MQIMLVSTLRRMHSLLSKQEERQVILLFIPMTLTALMNVAGVAFIVPFIMVATNPTTIMTNAKLSWLYQHLNFSTPNHFLIFLGLVVLLMLVFMDVLGALTTWFSIKIVSSIRVAIAHRLLAAYLYKPYIFFLDNNSAILSRNIFQSVTQIVTGILQSGMQVISGALVVCLIFILLIFANPLLSIIAFITIAGSYGGIYLFVKQKLSLAGNRVNSSEEKCFQTVSEVFGGIKDIKLFRNESIFLDKFVQPQKIIAYNQALVQTIQQLPKYFLEVIAFGAVLLLIISMLVSHHSITSIMPIISLYVLAGYRLMPAVQVIFAQVTNVRAAAKSLDVLYDNLKNRAESVSIKKTDLLSCENYMKLEKELVLKNITFSYPNSKSKVIDNLNLNIKAKTIVGFVGTTGAGKTTLIDIILGLLEPQGGSIYIDDIKLTLDTLPGWQLNLGYVPQHIYLSDDTILRNIAFGVPDSEIDIDAAIRAAQAAAIHDFINASLPAGYETVIGENGVRLSGGQRQRLGIARALYRNPAILIFDEATSALDGATESAIMDSIKNIAHQKTILIIAHRLVTVAQCDSVVLLSQGKVQDVGTFLELTERNADLRKMAKLE